MASCTGIGCIDRGDKPSAAAAKLILAKRVEISDLDKYKLFQWVTDPRTGTESPDFPYLPSPSGVKPPQSIGKPFFSTRRPALETGGQRPTARCALGRKSVWFVVNAMTISSPSPRACGERAGVRGSYLLRDPLPRIAEAIRPLPASGAR